MTTQTSKEIITIQILLNIYIYIYIYIYNTYITYITIHILQAYIIIIAFSCSPVLDFETQNEFDS